MPLAGVGSATCKPFSPGVVSTWRLSGTRFEANAAHKGAYESSQYGVRSWMAE